MGGSLVSYLGAALPAPPAAWGLHSADVVDPKVPPLFLVLPGLYHI
jgi:hypothetical protein